MTWFGISLTPPGCLRSCCRFDRGFSVCVRLTPMDRTLGSFPVLWNRIGPYYIRPIQKVDQWQGTPCESGTVAPLYGVTSFQMPLTDVGKAETRLRTSSQDTGWFTLVWVLAGFTSPSKRRMGPAGTWVRSRVALALFLTAFILYAVGMQVFLFPTAWSS